MAVIQDAVKIMAITVFAIMLPLLLPGASGETVEPEPEIRIFYDRTKPADILHPYNLRLLILEAPYGVQECWEKLPNGTIIQVCKPVQDVLVKVWYEEMKELREARTGSDGVASLEFRLWTIKATFKIEVYSQIGVVEEKVAVDASPWLTITYICFAGLVSSLVFAVRRGLW